MEALESKTWRTVPSLAEVLEKQPHRLSFQQAMRTVEALYPQAIPYAEKNSDFLGVLIRLRSRIYLSTPGSDIASWHKATTGLNGPSYELVVNFMGLAGIQGPLPMFVTELLLERIQNSDYALRDFLDIFNHRLLSLMRVIGRRYSVGVADLAPERMALGEGIFALMGLDLQSLRNRLACPDRSLLAYAGLIWQRPRSLAGLQALLQTYFKLPVSIVSNVGQWIELPQSDCTRLGRSGRFRALGRGAALGTRVWDTSVRFHIRFGPLNFDTFQKFYGDSEYGKSLKDLVHFYAGLEHDFSASLMLAGTETRPLRLGRSSHLGYTTWLRAKNEYHIEDQNVFLYTNRFQSVNLDATKALKDRHVI